MGRVVALDIGTKRTGVATTDECRIIASPHSVIQATNKKEWIEQVVPLLQELEAEEVVIGLPLDQNGEQGRDAKAIQQFIALLRERVAIPVIEWDERYTTVQAEEILIEADLSRQKRKTVIDKIAAALILERYLHHHSQ